MVLIDFWKSRESKKVALGIAKRTSVKTPYFPTFTLEQKDLRSQTPTVTLPCQPSKYNSIWKTTERKSLELECSWESIFCIYAMCCSTYFAGNVLHTSPINKQYGLCFVYPEYPKKSFSFLSTAMSQKNIIEKCIIV